MKLLNKYSRVHIITACIVLLISSIAYYFIIRTILIKQIDKDLKVEEQEIVDFIKANAALPHASDYKHQQIRFEVLKEYRPFRETSNTIEFDVKEKDSEPYRRLSFPVQVKGVSYKASVYKSQVETEDLLRLIMITTAIIFIVLSTLMFLINRLVLGKLWQPFFNTLSELKNFDLNKKQHLQLSSSSIEEFEELNRSVLQMTEKVSSEYETLKTFTDNASHEMQTPLAIIRSKLDLLIQSSSENQVDQLQAIYDATGRLTKLNQTLLLLTKIDNKQYQKPELINLKTLLENKFSQFDELIKGKNITLTSDVKEISVTINRDLIEILLNNLLNNAVRHNFDGGTIHCHLTSRNLSITNTGPLITFDKASIFNRFQKSNHSDGSGLGLAVVKQICDVSGLSIDYHYNNNKHTFTLMF
ncbi:MAG: sensor histidine kinase [Segetibacter sp.]|nr:sensor histidine kinase [Segetibacter sp.]